MEIVILFSIKHQKKKISKFISFILFLFIFIINFSNSSSEILNNIIVFNSTHYRAGSLAFNSNGDMVIEYSYNNLRLFYGLKKNGKGYFKKNDKEITIKEIIIGNDINNKRFESRSAFISLNNANNNEQYFFNTGVTSITELSNLETEEIDYLNTTYFLGETI